MKTGPHKTPPHACLVCGHRGLGQAPRSESGGGSFEICVCCGFQYGVDDDDRGIDPATARERWIAGGSRWFSRSTPPPAGWDPHRQLEHAGLAGPGKRP
jgi:hypothetical protein